MSDDSIPRRRRDQQLPAEQAELTDPASRAIVAVLYDDNVIFALRITLYSWLRGDRAEYEEARAHLLHVLRMHRDFFTACGRDDARVQEHIDYFLWLDWLRLKGVEIVPPDVPVPRVATLNPRTRGRPSGRMPAADFHAALARGLTACSGQKLTQETLAQKSGMAANTLRDYLEVYGPPWDLLRHCRSLVGCEKLGWARPP